MFFLTKADFRIAGALGQGAVFRVQRVLFVAHGLNARLEVFDLGVAEEV
ncbi:MAG: hypothetical protein RIR97_1498, partial [Pseudomonadota bacterium]